MLSHPANPIVLPISWAIAIGSAVVAAWFDVRGRRIPNLLTGPLFVAGITCATIGGGLGGLAGGLLACVLMATPFIVLWLFAGGGAADAKLMGALGTWLGLTGGTVTLVSVLGCGVAMGIGWAAWNRRLGQLSGNILLMSCGFASLAAGRRSPRQLARAMPDHRGMLKMPYGVAICAGVCIAAAGVHLWRF